MSTPTPVLLNKPATAAAAAVPVPALAANCMDSFVSALRAMPLDTILPSETLVATTGMRVPEVLQRLSTADILAMPVVDDATGECVGTVGMSELVEFATLIVPQPNTWAYEMDSKDIEMERWTTATVRDVLAAVTRRDDYALETLPPTTTTATKAADGKDAAAQTTAAAAPTGLSVWQVFELMAEKHLRRLCIVTPATAGATAKAGAANRVRGFVTQSMLIRVCRELLTGAATAKTFGDAAARVPIGSILAVQWHSGHVITAHIHDPVITSFLRIIRSGIQGLAVVDDAGDIKSVLSIRDLRGVLRPQTAADKDTDPTSPSAATSAASTTATGATPGLPTASSAAQRITAPGSAYGVRLWQLWCTTERFCERFAKPHSVNALKEPVFGTQFLTPASSLERALIMFADDSVHRCFVLRNEPHTTCPPTATATTTTATGAHATASTKPLSVISQTDCLAYVLWLAKHYTAPAQLGTPQRYVYSVKPVVTSAPPTTFTSTATSGSAK